MIPVFANTFLLRISGSQSEITFGHGAIDAAGIEEKLASGEVREVSRLQLPTVVLANLCLGFMQLLARSGSTLLLEAMRRELDRLVAEPTRPASETPFRPRLVKAEPEPEPGPDPEPAS